MYILLTIILILLISNILTYLIIKKDINKKVEQKVKLEIKKQEIELNNYFDKIKKEKQKEVDKEYQEYISNKSKEITIQESKLQNKIFEKKNQISLLNKEIEVKEQMIQQGKNSIDSELSLYKENELTKIKHTLEKETERQIKEQENQLQTHMAAMGAQAAAMQVEMEQLQSSLEDYYEKQKVINEAILRQKELQEQKTFYKLNLTEDEIQDILYIREFENKFSNKELLQKAVYECYYKKPLADLIKRVLRSEEFSGIYKITSLKTNEIYIGRAVNIKKRWTDHIKSSMGIGTLVNSTIHKRLAADGVWNFTFEVLEEIDKDKLSEREAYWVDFYQSNIYGMNEKKGG